jgi:hypothetical protein
MIPPYIQHGQVQLSEPCSIPWKSMDPVEGRNRFCRECKKVVHNITGMGPAEIHALLQSDPGNICVNFTASRLPADTETKFTRVKTPAPVRFGYIAATAAALLLLQQTQTAPLAQTTTAWMPSRPAGPLSPTANTLVSGTVVDQYGNPVPGEIDVIISCGDVDLMRLQTRGGLFSCDLAGHVGPDDTITLSVVPGPQASSDVSAVQQVSEATGEWVLPPSAIILDVVPWVGHTPPSWSAGKQTVRLADAQNVQIAVTYFVGGYEPFVQMGGVPPITFGQTLSVSLFVPYPVSPAKPSTPRSAQDHSCTR